MRKRTWGRRAWCCSLAILCVGLVAAPGGAATKPKASAPEAPTIMSVTAGPHRVRVKFAAPANDGGASIESDRVKGISSDGGKTALRSGHTSPIRVLGVTGGKTYTCTVVARNR